MRPQSDFSGKGDRFPSVSTPENVWAIGTGVAASPEDVASAHSLVKRLLPNGSGTPVLYGGSVKPGNASSLAAIDGVDGFLIGGASLKPEDYTAIIRAFIDSKGC